MQTDEEQIRQLVADWLEASRAGDVGALLEMVTDDVVFLLPGQPPMRKADFVARSRAQTGPQAPKIDGHSEILELQVAGDWAYMWTRLSVTIEPPGGQPKKRAGHTLTVLHRIDGKWRLARDANLLVNVE